MNAEANDAHAALWFVVARLCSEDEKGSGTSYSPEFVESLSQIVYSQAETMGADLEHFARHAKRAKISVDDVKLCARRNKMLAELIAARAESIKENATK